MGKIVNVSDHLYLHNCEFNQMRILSFLLNLKYIMENMSNTCNIFIEEKI